MSMAPPPSEPTPGTGMVPYGNHAAAPGTANSATGAVPPGTAAYPPYATAAPYGAVAPYGHPVGAPPVAALPLKDSTTAYLLAIFLGGFGAHNFYLGRTGIAIGQLVLWQFGVWTSWLGIGLIALLAGTIWWIVDLCTIPGIVQRVNASRVAAAHWPPQQRAY